MNKKNNKINKGSCPSWASIPIQTSEGSGTFSKLNLVPPLTFHHNKYTVCKYFRDNELRDCLQC